MLRLNKQNVPAGATLRVVLTPLKKGIRRNDERDTTVPSRRFPVVDRRTTSSRKDKVSFLFVAIASDVSRAVQFCYIMHAVSPQVRSSAYPSSFLSLLFSRGSSFSTNLLVQYSDGGCIDVTPRQRDRARFLDRELYFAARLSLLRCNNAGSYVYTRLY